MRAMPENWTLPEIHLVRVLAKQILLQLQDMREVDWNPSWEFNETGYKYCNMCNAWARGGNILYRLGLAYGANPNEIPSYGLHIEINTEATPIYYKFFELAKVTYLTEEGPKAYWPQLDEVISAYVDIACNHSKPEFSLSRSTSFLIQTATTTEVCDAFNVVGYMEVANGVAQWTDKVQRIMIELEIWNADRQDIEEVHDLARSRQVKKILESLSELTLRRLAKRANSIADIEFAVAFKTDFRELYEVMCDHKIGFGDVKLVQELMTALRRVS